MSVVDQRNDKDAQLIVVLLAYGPIRGNTIETRSFMCNNVLEAQSLHRFLTENSIPNAVLSQKTHDKYLSVRNEWQLVNNIVGE